MNPRIDLPVLDPTRCIGSATCVAVCPVGCLEMAGPNPWLPRPGDCTSCSLCVLVCPTRALSLPVPSRTVAREPADEDAEPSRL